MSRSLNKVQLIGNLGQDPEMRHTQSGLAVTNMNLATSDTWKDQSGVQQDRTEWHRVVMFGKLAEIAKQYLRKGSKVYIEGSLQTRKWTDQQGQDRYTTEVILRPFSGAMLMLDSRQQGGGAEGFSGGPPISAYEEFASTTSAASASSFATSHASSDNSPDTQHDKKEKRGETEPPEAFQQSPSFDDDVPF